MGEMGREWGVGFKWWVGNALDVLIDRCRQLRAHGIIPHVSCFDQPDIGRATHDGWVEGPIPYEDQRAMLRDFAQAMNGECSLINYSWELDERWYASDEGWMATEALPELCRIVYDENPELRFAIHTAREEWGGFNLYGSLESNATRYWQMNGASDVAHIREVAHRLGPVHQRTGTNCNVMEHSPSTRLSPRYSQEEANRRAKAGVEVLQGYIGDARIGSLNGDPR
jgi:hypothetical protein